MRRIVTILCVLSVVVGAASASWATYYTGFVPFSSLTNGTGYFMFTNQDNGGYESYAGPNFTSPTATTDGALWLKTGAGAPAYLDQDVNMSLSWRPNSGAGWTPITTILLNDANTTFNGTLFTIASATWDGGIAGAYPGYFQDWSGGFDPPYHPGYSSYETGAGQYYLPGSAGLNFSLFQFDIQAWTGTTYSSYSAAVGHVYTADSGAFLANPGTDPNDTGVGIGTISTGGGSPLSFGAFFKMPAMVLQMQSTPEPSTVVLLATGLIGLLAYAWRKRK